MYLDKYGRLVKAVKISYFFDSSRSDMMFICFKLTGASGLAP